MIWGNTLKEIPTAWLPSENWILLQELSSLRKFGSIEEVSETFPDSGKFETKENALKSTARLTVLAILTRRALRSWASLILTSLVDSLLLELRLVLRMESSAMEPLTSSGVKPRSDSTMPCLVMESTPFTEHSLLNPFFIEFNRSPILVILSGFVWKKAMSRDRPQVPTKITASQSSASTLGDELADQLRDTAVSNRPGKLRRSGTVPVIQLN